MRRHFGLFLEKLLHQLIGKTLCLVYISVFLVLLSGCGSGGNSEILADSSDVPIDGLATSTPLINSANVRVVAIESLEVVDTLVYLFGKTGSVVLDSAIGSNECVDQGRVLVSETVDGRSYQFDNCRFVDDIDVSINGHIDLFGGFENGFFGNARMSGFTINTAGRSIMAVGNADASIEPGTRSVNNLQLTIDDSQSLVQIEDSAFMVVDLESAEQTVTVDLIADFDRFGLNDVLLKSDGLLGSNVSCASTGTLLVDAYTDGSVLIKGGEGDNLMITSDGFTDTLSCREVAAIGATAIIGPVQPPPLPGSQF